MPTAYQKLEANLKFLRERNAPKERIKAEIEKFRASQNRVSANERKLSGAEKVAAVGSKLGSGATFGLLDEAVGLFDEDSKNEQRFLQKQLSEENPGAAFGAEVLGSIAMPGSIFKAAPKAAGLVRKGATVLAEGAAQGGLAGMGQAEGGLEERLRGFGKGASAGAIGAGVLGGATRAVSGTARRAGEAFGLVAPKLDELAAKVSDEDVLSARRKMGEYSGRRLGDEATVADVLPQGEGALRQAATTNREVRRRVDKELRERMNRLSSKGDERFSEYTGTQPKSGRKSVEELNAEASQRAAPHYDAARKESLAAPKKERLTAAQRAEMEAMGVPKDKVPSDEIDEALSLPFVQQRIDQLRRAPRSKFKDVPDDDYEMLHNVYTDIGRQIRSLDRKDWSLKQDLIQQRGILAEAIESRSPSYAKARSEFADPMARREAFEMGSKNTPSDVIPSELKGLDAGEAASYKEAVAQRLRREVPNLDIGEYARFSDVLAPIATREKAQTMKAAFGEDAYNDYVKDLLAMAGLQRMKAGAGESTTVDKLLEQLQSEPEAIVGMVGQLLRGNPMAAIAQFQPSGVWGKAIDKLRNNRSAMTNADFLLRRGEDQVKKSLDELLAIRDASKRSGGRSYRGQKGRRALGATARVAGGSAGRE